MRKTVFTFLLSVIYMHFYAPLLYAQLFRQDFESSATLSTYISSTPTNQQFTSISVSGSNGNVSIVNNSGNNVLQMQVGTGTGRTTYFNRTTDFNVSGSPPATLIVQFDLQVTISGGANIGAGSFRIGSSYSDNAAIQAGTYARFGINLTNNNDEFQVRDFALPAPSATNSATFTGKNKITFVLNNSGFTQNYFAPNGTTVSVANDTYDLWIGSTLVFNDLAVADGTQTLSDMKFLFDGDNSIIQLDNFLISENLNLLPVAWLYLDAKELDNQILISWVTIDEKDNYLYEIQRADEAILFQTIGEVKPVLPDRQNTYQYQFIDKKPFKGNNYYRIKQIDLDKSYSFSKIIQAKSKNRGEVVLFPNPAQEILNITFSEKDIYQISIHNTLGETLLAGTCEGRHWQTSISSLLSGIYFIKISNKQINSIQKIIVDK